MRKFAGRSLSLAAMAFAIGAVAFDGTPAYAQTTQLRDVSTQLDRLRREVQTLQRTVYRGGTPPASTAPAAPTTVTPTAPTGFAANFEVRLSDLENVIRRLEQRVETLEVSERRNQERLEKFTSDLEVRLRNLEQGAAPPPPVAGNRASSKHGAANAATMTGGTRAPDAPPRPLGTLRTNKKDDKGQTARSETRVASLGPALPPGNAKQQYDFALSLILNEQDFAKAENAFRAFIENHPKSNLTGNAYFWLGQTHFVRKQYEDAAFAFADGFKKFPRGTKAPENLYKLGMSLRQLGRQREACTAFSRLLDNYPKINRTLKSRIARQQKRLKCTA